MDLMNRDRDDLGPAPSSPSLLRSIDMAIAARTRLPVLVTAPPALALGMAFEIATGTNGVRADSVVVIDAADNQDVWSTLMHAEAEDCGRIRAVVLLDVDFFDAAQQAALFGLLTDPDCPIARAWRVIATTSVPLFDRVMQGSFDPGLFYRLNTIHIMA